MNNLAFKNLTIIVGITSEFAGKGSKTVRMKSMNCLEDYRITVGNCATFLMTSIIWQRMSSSKGGEGIYTVVCIPESVEGEFHPVPSQLRQFDCVSNYCSDHSNIHPVVIVKGLRKTVVQDSRTYSTPRCDCDHYA